MASPNRRVAKGGQRAHEQIMNQRSQAKSAADQAAINRTPKRKREITKVHGRRGYEYNLNQLDGEAKSHGDYADELYRERYGEYPKRGDTSRSQEVKKKAR